MLLRLDDVDTYYGEIHILQRVSLDAQHGGTQGSPMDPFLKSSSRLCAVGRRAKPRSAEATRRRT